MRDISSYLIRGMSSLAVATLVACTGAQIGLNELRAVNPTEPFSALESSGQAQDDVGAAVNQLIANYRSYGALYAAVEQERPTAENTCFELKERVERVKPLLVEQQAVLAGTEKLYLQLATHRVTDPRVGNAVQTGKAHVAKARERVQTYLELADITYSFTGDCPSEGEMIMHVMTGISALGAIDQYERAKQKAPAFNQTVQRLEALSVQERRLAYEVVQSLDALMPGGAAGRGVPH